jgi:ATP-binding cassette subfamily F protein uup
MLLQLNGVSLAFGGPTLLDAADLRLERGERVCVVGRNGSGKSSLLKLVAGELRPDEGNIQFGAGVRLGCLPQEVPRDLKGSVFEVTAGGLPEVGPLLAQFHHLSQQLAATPSERLLTEFSEVQQKLEAEGGWTLRARVETVLSRLGLTPEADFAQLSGGVKRRVMLGRALVAEPDLLLLDEPTNHLDIDSITWLEESLLAYNGGLLFITHDRRFLQRLATRIVELDRGRLSSFPGSFEAYQQRKQAELEAEANQNALFDKKLAAEEVWIRQGIKARRTRNEGRVRALLALREARSERRERQGTAKVALQEAERSGKLVAQAEGISYKLPDKPLIDNFSTTILRGDKIGVIGPNGVGKTTLLKLLLGQLQPQQGQVRLGTKLEVAYFDQLRMQLDEEASVVDNVGGGSDKVMVNGQPKHIIGYLQDFLFPPARSRVPVKALSGGERNRLLLAKLFTRPANVLVMDEPTNDLDMETLELLEELLTEFSGTLLLVSHDRSFINNVVTSVIAFEGEGQLREYVGGYDDWLRQRPQRTEPSRERAAPAPAPKAAAPAKPERARKLSYKEQRELETLPQQIEALEREMTQVQERLGDPALYRDEPALAAELTAKLASLESALEDAFERWGLLEAQQ